MRAESASREAFTWITQIVFRQKLHIAACATAAGWGWSKLLGPGLSGWPLVVIPLTVLCVYQWNRLTDIREDLLNCPVDARSAIAHSLAIKWFCAASLAAIFIILARDGSYKADCLVAVCLAFGYCYSSPVSRWWRIRRLKQITLAKDLSSALGWSLLTIVYPAAVAGGVIGLRLWLMFAIMFLAVSGVEFTWDIRDVSGDKFAGIKSIPVVYGVRITEGYILGLNLLSGILVAAGLALGYLANAWVFILLNALLMLISAIRIHRAAKVDRTWANAMVVIQALMLLGIGFSAR